MNTSPIKLPTGQPRLSIALYFTDLIHSDTREIPIGVISEVRLDQLRGIGAAFRTDYTPDELDNLGPVARKLLTASLDDLWESIVNQFKSGQPGKGLESIASMYSSSISVLAPRSIQVPKRWLLEKDLSKLRTIVEEGLETIVVNEYYDWIFPRDSGREDLSIKEEWLEAEAA